MPQTSPLSYSEAIEIVYEMAGINQVDETDIAFGDEGMEGERAWQQEALETLGDLVTNQHEEIDERYAPSATGALMEFAEGEAVTDPAMDPTRPQACIRICLEMARNVPSEMVDDPERSQAAVALVEDFVLRHGESLDADLATIKLS